MVCKWGMSERLGPVDYSDGEERLFLGGEISRSRSHSEATALEIDKEVRCILDECHERAKTLIAGRREDLDRITVALLKYETLTAEEVDRAMRGEPVRPDPPAEPEAKSPAPEEKGEPPEEEDSAPATEDAPAPPGDGA
jgi:cell division protease FtsH